MYESEARVAGRAEVSSSPVAPSVAVMEPAPHLKSGRSCLIHAQGCYKDCNSYQYDFAVHLRYVIV